MFARGSFQFWVLKPGGRAFVGRGISPDIPFGEAREFRRKAGSGPKYDPDETAREFRALMEKLGLFEFEILRPHVGETDVNYGVWLVLKKTTKQHPMLEPAVIHARIPSR